MLAIIILLCGLLGLWVNIYSLFALLLFVVYYYGFFTKIRWEHIVAFAGLLLGALNIILVLITKHF